MPSIAFLLICFSTFCQFCGRNFQSQNINGFPALLCNQNTLEPFHYHGAVAKAIPSLPEQEKIGAYFSSLDALLAARREEVAKLRDLKKALLERMFV